MNKSVRNLVLLALMVSSSGMAVVLRPTERIADQGPAVNLETLMPRQFGDWRVDDKVVYQQVSPDVGAALAKIYTQVLTRTYVNKAGYRIMLSAVDRARLAKVLRLAEGQMQQGEAAWQYTGEDIALAQKVAKALEDEHEYVMIADRWPS